MRNYTVTIIEGPNCCWEADALRHILEGFNMRVYKHRVGRPNDFINYINGHDVPLSSDFIIFSFHGKNGLFDMPQLGESIYTPNEPRHAISPEDIKQYFKLKSTTIINLGCSLGKAPMAKAFINNGCQTYIGALDDIEGNSSLFFAIRLFYELCTNQKTIKEAFDLSQATDKETRLFHLYTRDEHQ